MSRNTEYKIAYAISISALLLSFRSEIGALFRLMGDMGVYVAIIAADISVAIICFILGKRSILKEAQREKGETTTDNNAQSKVRNREKRLNILYSASTVIAILALIMSIVSLILK